MFASKISFRVVPKVSATSWRDARESRLPQSPERPDSFSCSFCAPFRTKQIMQFGSGRVQKPFHGAGGGLECGRHFFLAHLEVVSLDHHGTLTRLELGQRS